MSPSSCARFLQCFRPRVGVEAYVDGSVKVRTESLPARKRCRPFCAGIFQHLHLLDIGGVSSPKVWFRNGFWLGIPIRIRRHRRRTAAIERCAPLSKIFSGFSATMHASCSTFSMPRARNARSVRRRCRGFCESVWCPAPPCRRYPPIRQGFPCSRP